MNRKEEFLSNCVVIDTETTNIDKEKAEVIELGLAVRSNNTWSGHSFLYQPTEMPIQPEISAVTHITDDMVLDKPFFQDRINVDLNPILKSLNDNSGSVIAHNSQYDSTVLNRYKGIEKINSPWICTMRLCKHLYGEDDTVKQFNLPYLRYRFKLDIPKNLEHHRASSDAFITGRLLEHVVSEMENRKILDDKMPYKQQMDQISSTPIFIHKMPFGKHANEKWDTIPKSYLVWAINNLSCLKEDDALFDPDMAYTFEQIMVKHL